MARWLGNCWLPATSSSILFNLIFSQSAVFAPFSPYGAVTAAAAMEDADVYAYELELAEADEWEAMHAHEMEAAEEEMRAMEAAERRLAAPVAAPVEAPVEASAGADGLSRAQRRLDRVLARCATLLGEDDEPSDVPLSRPADADADAAQFLHARPPADAASASVVLGDGRRVFLRRKSAAAAELGAAAQRRKADVSTLVPIQRLQEALQMVSGVLGDVEAVRSQRGVLWGGAAQDRREHRQRGRRRDGDRTSCAPRRNPQEHPTVA